MHNFAYYEPAFRSPARQASLYSDFTSQRTSNPEGYEANCKAWLNALTSFAWDKELGSGTPPQSNQFVIQSSTALHQSCISSEYGVPLALDAVLEHGVVHRDLLPLQEYLSAHTSINEKDGWPTTWQVVSWGLQKIGLSGTRHNIPKGSKLVMRKNLEASCNAILSMWKLKHLSRADSVFTKDMFLAMFESEETFRNHMSPDDFKVLVTYLSRDLNAIAYDAATETIKFRHSSEVKPTPITQEDVDIASLRSLMVTLEQQVLDLNKRIAQLDRTARDAVTAKNTLAAKIALRSKKMAQSTLEQRSTTLHQLEEVFAKIEQAADQVEIIQVLEASGRTLKALNEKTGGVDKVHDIMDVLKDEAMTTDEIGQAINEDSHNVVDEGEVEDEFEALEKIELEKQNQEKDAAKQVQLDQEAEETRKMLAALESPTKAEARQATVQGLGSETASNQKETPLPAT